jgi:hypothetical protein
MKHWLKYFEWNREHRRNVPWSDRIDLPPEQVAAFVRSLQRFQVGESGEGRHLRAAANTTGDQDYIRVIDLFIREEQEHARLMGDVLKRIPAPLLISHWSDGCFVLLRRLFGLNQELMVLLVPEIIARRYFAALRDRIGHPTVTAVCEQILHDEEGHVAFHVEFLQRAFTGMSLPARVLLRAVWRALFRLALLVVVLDHRSLLRVCGVPASHFWWDCELMFDEVAAEIFATAPRRPAAGPLMSAERLSTRLVQTP